MKHEALEKMFNTLGRSLFRDKERVTVELLGSAALILGYNCWDNANDVDARWSQEDSFILGPLIAEIGQKCNHTKGSHWMNSDAADIIHQEGTWARTVEYGYLSVRIPTAEFLMSILVQGLYTCQVDSEQYPPFGKMAAQCLALAHSQKWDKSDILREVAPFLPRGIPPACEEWLDRLFASGANTAKRPEMFGAQENCDNLMTRG